MSIRILFSTTTAAAAAAAIAIIAEGLGKWDQR
jgi:hypothetical protein